MAGYVKLWTTLLDNTEFLGLSMAQRGAYVQLILECKKGRDDGTVSYRNETAMGSAWGCDRKISGKTLGILADNSLCTYSKNGNGVITIHLPNYKRWQEMTVEKVREKRRRITAKIPSLRAEQSKAEQSRAKQSSDTPKSGRKEKQKIPDTDHHQIIEYWVNEYEKKFGIKYNFLSGKDGTTIKRLLKAFPLEILKKMTDDYFNNPGKWVKGVGLSMTNFQHQSNKLAQKLANPQNPQFEGLSEKGKEFAQTAIRVGKELGIEMGGNDDRK